MIYIGIDIAKNTHWASAMSSDGEILLQPFSFQNNNEGFQKFISKLSCFDKQKMLIGLESTAHYGENIISYLFNLDYKIGLINPIQTANLRKSNIRKTKNDKIDTFLITQCLILGHYTLITEKDIQLIKLKTLCRFKFDIKKSQSKAKTQLVTCLDIAFPELANFFNDNLHIKSSYALLSKYPTARIISNTRIDALTNLLYSASRGHFKMHKALALKELAKNTIGFHDDNSDLLISSYITSIKHFNEHLDSLESKISTIIKELNPSILTIPGLVKFLLHLLLLNMAKFLIFHLQLRCLLLQD